VDSAIRGDAVTASVRTPGVYCVFADRAAPRIGAPSVRKRVSFATEASLPEIVIPIQEKGSGVDDERTTVYVNGQKRIARWDGFSERLYVLLREEGVAGSHDLTIVAGDQAGNVSRLETRLVIPDNGRKKSNR